jgi:transaldolase
MSKLEELANLGQSIWLDYIQRSLITSGELKDLVDQGLRGVTSNPSIFDKAIAGSTDYDTELKQLIESDKSIHEIYESLALADIAMAADVLAPVYAATQGRDGFVSLEVNPDLAHDTQKTIDEAKQLFERLNRPNVMIKVPATPAGLPAITELISAGVNVNVTLIFGLDNYKAVAGAYLDGLEKLAQSGPSVSGGCKLDKVGSVASFFVSRVDTAVDRALEKAGNTALQGKIAIANSKIAYEEYRRIFSGPRWESLAVKGARAQRVLWASTSTKNPAYPENLYVDELIGPNTVNTLPPATLKSFTDHGIVSETLTKDVEFARKEIDQLAELGIDLKQITRQLQDEGVAAFAKSFASLITGIKEKREKLLA